MSQVDTKWKKTYKRKVNTEGLKNKEGKNGDKSRDEKDDEQKELLDDLKQRIKRIQNKRKGFTKLPHLTDITDESKDKEEFKEGVKNNKEEFKEGWGGSRRGIDFGWLGNIFSILGKFVTFISSEPYRFFVFTYISFVVIYLQLYHLNFKEDIMTNFPEKYRAEINELSETKTNEENEENEDKIPRDFKSISENILDSITKTLSKMVWDKEYTDIKHNSFLQNMNLTARLDGGLFMRYIFIPAQIIVGIFQNLIPNLNLMFSKNSFPLLFTFLFGVFFSSSFVGDIDSIKNAREFERKENAKIHDKIIYNLKQYYAKIPISYFILVGLVIFGAFGLDTFKEMTSGSFFRNGIFGFIAQSLFKLFLFSMSIVLSGFSAIPVALFFLMWILFPEGVGVPKFSKWSNAIRDNYWLPEIDVCEDNRWKKWGWWFIKRVWNNKLFISAFAAMDIAIRLYYGDGNLTSGGEKMNATGSKAFIGHIIMGVYLFIFMFPYYPTERKTSLHKYLYDWIPMLMQFGKKIMIEYGALKVEEAKATEDGANAVAKAEMEGKSEGEMLQGQGDDPNNGN